MVKVFWKNKVNNVVQSNFLDRTAEEARTIVFLANICFKRAVHWVADGRRDELSDTE